MDLSKEIQETRLQKQDKLFFQTFANFEHSFNFVLLLKNTLITKLPIGSLVVSTSTESLIFVSNF